MTNNTIHIDNYEEWFLMYVDNELDAAGRQAVDDFLLQHPYLQKEMELLQQTILQPDATSMPGKLNLLKPETDSHLQTDLLLMLDGELPPTRLSSLLLQLQTNAGLQAEWALLQKTRLDNTEIITYPYKQLLYKKTGARIRPLVFFKWTAVAAIAIGIGFFVITQLQNKFISTGHHPAEMANKAQADTANLANSSNNNSQPVITHSPLIPMPDSSITSPIVSQNTVNPANLAVTKNKTHRTTDVNNITTNGMQKENTKWVNNTGSLAANTKPAEKNKEAREPLRNQLPNNVTHNPQQDVAMQLKSTANPSPITGNSLQTLHPKKELVDEYLTANTAPNQYAQTASLAYNEGNHSFLVMEEENINRTKTGAFFKKLKRNIERRANIKPGKSLKIAGFEFAMK